MLEKSLLELSQNCLRLFFVKNATNIDSYQLSSTTRYRQEALRAFAFFVYKRYVFSYSKVYKGFFCFGFYRSGDVYKKQAAQKNYQATQLWVATHRLRPLG